MEHADVRLWDGGSREGFIGGAGRFLGALSHMLLRDLHEIINCAGLNKAMREGECLILPFEGLPGMYSSLLIWDGTKFIAKSITSTNNVNEGGLLGLSQVVDVTGDILAIGDPVLYLRMCKQWAANSSKVMPTVCYAAKELNSFHCSTVFAWEALTQSRIVFWSSELSVECINYARSLGIRGFVAIAPTFASGVSPVDAVPVQTFMAKAFASAIKWEEALRRLMLNANAVEFEYIRQHMQPQISEHEQRRILDLCTEEERDKLSLRLNNNQQIRSFKWEGNTIIERPDYGWFRTDKSNGARNQEILLSEPIIVTKEVTVIDSKTYYYGTVRMTGKEAEFTIEESEIRDPSCAWINQFCMRNFNQLPVISFKFRNKLLDLAIARGKPAVAQTPERIGWDRANHQWVFPQFTIKDGKVGLHETRMTSIKKTPAVDLLPGMLYPRPSQVDSWLEQSQLNQFRFAMLIALLHNLVAPSVGKSTCGIVVINAEEMAHSVINDIGARLTLNQFNGNGIAKLPTATDALVAMEHRHDLPVVLLADEFHKEPWRQWLNTTGRRNCIVTASHKDAANLITNGGWLIINGFGVTDKNVESEMDGFLSLIPLLLQTISKAKLTDNNDVPLFQHIATSLIDYMSKGKPDTDFSIIERAAEIVQQTSTSKIERLIWTVAYMMNMLGDKESMSIIQKLNQKETLIRWAKLTKAFDRHQMVYPDPMLLDMEAASRSDVRISLDEGWVIKGSTLSTEFIRCMKITGQLPQSYGS